MCLKAVMHKYETDLKLAPTASRPRQILNADAPLVVWNTAQIHYYETYKTTKKSSASMINSH